MVAHTIKAGGEANLGCTVTSVSKKLKEKQITSRIIDRKLLGDHTKIICTLTYLQQTFQK
jgi:hypothetical protein